LEIGCGLGTDGAQFAQAGADYTGVDLTEAAVELARKRFSLFDLPGDEEFLSQNTDGAGNPLSRVYSRAEAGALLQDFSEVTLKAYFFTSAGCRCWANYCRVIGISARLALWLAFVDICD